jgi:hypothetical protein
MLRTNYERIIDYTSPEGMRRQEELANQRGSTMSKHLDGKNPFAGADEAGWGKAREDLTWVKDHKRPG